MFLSKNMYLDGAFYLFTQLDLFVKNYSICLYSKN